ncbi:MAG: hypothetical protein Q8904_06065 [Bacteroidota bacterium]|nr:hypothetical protein [Bacteroidota bacterium]
MGKRNVLAMLVIAFGVANFTTSCSSDSASASATATTLTATASDESQAATISDNVDNEVDNYVTTSALNGSGAVKSLVGTTVLTGPTITIDKPDSTNFPKTFTIDYGTTGFIGQRGDTLKGKVIVVVSNKMWKATSTRTMTFNNFSINGNAVTGKKVLTYDGLIGLHPTWTLSAKDTITRTDGSKVIWNSDRTRERINDNGTPLIYWDDNYSISGGSNGVNAKGVAFTSVIDANNPLLIEGKWPFFTKGTVTTTSGNKTVVIDYGDGTKDNKAIVTTNGVTKTITLRK